ncbi:hypothetical protein Tco_0222910 [Tanacetum coccineum]
MYIFTFIHTPDPTKVKVVEQERNKGKLRLPDTTIGRTVLLLPFAPNRAKSELDASVERLFDEGGSGNKTEQGDSAGGGKDANIQPIIEAMDTVVEDVAPVSAFKRLLDGAVLNAEVGVAAMPTFPFMTTSIYTTLEREDGDHTDSVAGLNLRAIGAPPRFVISLDSSHHSGTNVAEAEVDSLVRSSVPIMTTITTITSMVGLASVAKERLVEPYPFCVDSSSAGGTDPTTGSVTNGSRLGDGRVCREMVDEFTPHKFFASVHGMEHDQLFTEFIVGATRQMSLSAEVRMRAEYNVKEKRRLKSVVERQVELLKVRKGEIKNLKAQLLLRETEVAKAIRLRAKASNFKAVTKLEASAVGKEHELTNLNALVRELDISSSELQEKVIVYENCMDQLEKFQYDRMKVVNDKFDKLYTDFVEMAVHLEEKFYPYLLTTISGRRRYIAGIVPSAGIHPGRVLIDVAAHNPSAEVDYTSALQQLQNVNFSLLAKLKSNKDANVKTVIDILRLEGLLAERLGLNELQPNVDQLMVLIHRSSDKVVLGATALSLALDVSTKPFFAMVLTSTEGTSHIVSATANTTTTLSKTFASTSSIAPISVDDYEVVGADDRAFTDGNAASLPNVDDAELNILQ